MDCDCCWFLRADWIANSGSRDLELDGLVGLRSRNEIGNDNSASGGVLGALNFIDSDSQIEFESLTLGVANSKETF